MKLLTLVLAMFAWSCSYGSAPPMSAEPPPKISLLDAVHIVSGVANEQFKEFRGIYCVKAEAPMHGLPRPDGKVVVWQFYYRIPNNGRDLEAEKKGWFNIWGDGIIELYEDKRCTVSAMPKVIKGKANK